MSTVRDRLLPRVEDDPADADTAAVDDALAAFTVAAAGHDEPRPLAAFARADGRVVAGIHGWTWGGCCELVSLGVNEPMRGRGLGRALLAAAEDGARALLGRDGVVDVLGSRVDGGSGLVLQQIARSWQFPS